MRLLAMMGAAHSIFLFGYNIPMQFFIANSSEWPEDIKTRSYFQQNLCGEGTEYLCWGRNSVYPRATAPASTRTTVLPGRISSSSEGTGRPYRRWSAGGLRYA